MLETLLTIAKGQNHRFPAGNHPFQIMTRLLEEAGELAQKVNHFEDTGVKRAKYGEPDRSALAKEVRDVLLCALQAAIYYGVEPELEAHLETAYTRLKAEGHIPETEER